MLFLTVKVLLSSSISSHVPCSLDFGACSPLVFSFQIKSEVVNRSFWFLRRDLPNFSVCLNYLKFLWKRNCNKKSECFWF